MADRIVALPFCRVTTRFDVQLHVVGINAYRGSWTSDETQKEVENKRREIERTAVSCVAPAVGHVRVTLERNNPAKRACLFWFFLSFDYQKKQKEKKNQKTKWIYD